MKKSSMTETKNNLSALIDGLSGGSPVLIVVRGRPVARLEPVSGCEDDEQNGRLSRLIRDGALRPRRIRRLQLFSAPLRRAPTRRRSTCSSTSGGKDGEKLGCFPPPSLAVSV
jgi:prevent-host-death family protein